MMKILENAGFPVVKAIRVVSYQGQYGIERSFIKGALDSEDVVTEKKLLPSEATHNNTYAAFNNNLFDSCMLMKTLLSQNQLAIDDLQFLIDENGNAFINDPRSVYPGFSDKAISKVNELKACALANIADFNDL